MPDRCTRLDYIIWGLCHFRAPPDPSLLKCFDIMSTIGRVHRNLCSPPFSYGFPIQEFIWAVVMVFYNEHLKLDQELIIQSMNMGMHRWFLSQPIQFTGQMKQCSHREEFEWLEFFAGTASCTLAMRMAGFHSARFDIKYANPKHRKSNWMNILSPSGFAYLSWCLCLCRFTVLVAIASYLAHVHLRGRL